MSCSGRAQPPVTRLITLALSVAVLALACGSDDADIVPSGDSLSGEVSAELVRTWVNQTGLPGPADTGDWETRLEEACAAPIWEQPRAEALAAGFIEADGGNAEDATLVTDAASALWLMAAEVCRESFPDGEIDKGPFTVRSG